ncbi:MAG: 4-alpha-glucanotransferase [Thermoguttaceae bacterium]|nr:4-alpha-glucanotransferase [Thermoguttaceae bacterium]
MTRSTMNSMRDYTQRFDDTTKKTRSSGVLAPLFSLPGIRDVGSLGRCARNFVDFLADTNQSWYQMLPITPIDEANSPYAGRSAFACETLYLDLEEFRDEGLLDDEDLTKAWFLPQIDEPNASSTPQTDARSERINYVRAKERREPYWKKAFDRYKRGVGGEKYRREEKRFREENADWLDAYLLFQTAAKKHAGYDWRAWPEEIKRRDPEALSDLLRDDRKNDEQYDYLLFLQLAFDVQWKEFKNYCASKSIRLIGDVPIYVGIFSADVWTNPDLFLIDRDGKIVREAGTPSDDFNSDAQHWGSPVYNWKKHQETNFQWWKRRMAKTLERFDAVRLDHFIGFYNYYSFPGKGVDPDSGEVGAMPVVELKEGEAYEEGWLPGPQDKFFDAIFTVCSKDAFIAEDLGHISPGVAALRDRLQLPGMKVIQYSFGKNDVEADQETGEVSCSLERAPENSVAYTGTHDSAPVMGWLDDAYRHEEALKNKPKDPNDDMPDFTVIAKVLERYHLPEDEPAVSPDLLEQDDATEESQKQVSTKYRRLRPQVAALRLATLRAVAQSPCKLAVFPMQDVLGLSNDSRINYPGVASGNWSWRFADGQLTPELRETLRTLTEEAKR